MMVQTAFKGVGAASLLPTAANYPDIATAEAGASASDLPRMESLSVSDGLSTFANSTHEPSHQQVSFGSGDHLDSAWQHDFIQQDDVEDETYSSIEELPGLPADESLAPSDVFFANLEVEPHGDYADDSHLSTDMSIPTESVSTVTGAAVIEDQVVDPHTNAAEVAAPAQVALPVWDSSQQEWPVLVLPPSETMYSRPGVRFALALLVLITFAAAFYFLINGTASPDQTSSAYPEGVSSVLASTPARSPAAETPHITSPASSSVSAAGDSKPTGTPASDAAATNDQNVQGRFSLQAAAFPTEAAADEFAEKLKQAGVPSYVVNADLARRGRWFRVRIGRFNTAEDAQRYSSEAQLRARASGTSLQLIVCQYEQP